MTTMAIDPTPAVRAYFSRIQEGAASEEEYRIFPEMLDRYTTDTPAAGEIEHESMFDGMSDAGKRGDFPIEGLVNAYEVCRFIGKAGLKKPGQALMKMVREGRFPPPIDMKSKPFLWLAEVVRAHVASFKGGKEVRSWTSERRSLQ